MSKSLASPRAPLRTPIAACPPVVPPGFDNAFAEAFHACIYADPVLIHGETGTGKEVVARALHAAGWSAGGQFVPVNCANLEKNLAAATLFGQSRGAFTGAAIAHGGLFGEAEGGTLFLDEIGELDRAVQAMLLRALENRSVMAVGGRPERAVRVRVLAATHIDLGTAVHAGQFRGDLYHRLTADLICLAPLRARVDQLPALCALLLPQIDAELASRVPDYRPQGGGICVETLALLANYGWPGNVRELRHVLHRARRFSSGGPLLPRHVQFQSPGAVPGVTPMALPAVSATLVGGERLRRPPLQAEEVARAMASAEGCVAAAARLLGVHRQALARWLAKQHNCGR